LTFETVRAPGPVESAGRFDPEVARRRVLAAEPFHLGQIVRYAMLPLDQRWAYHTDVRPVWNEPRPQFAEQVRGGNRFIVTRMAARRPDEGPPVISTSVLANHHLLDPNAHATRFASTRRRGGIADYSRRRGVRAPTSREPRVPG
jgi:hypothetical protein